MISIVFSDVSDAMRAWAENLPWEVDPARARVCLAALEFLLVARPSESQLAETKLSYESIKTELEKIRQFLGVGVRAKFMPIVGDTMI